jgi:PAS domain S-box-containing protein
MNGNSKNISKEALEEIADAIPAGVVVIEKANGKIIYVNEKAISLYGVDPSGLELPEHSTRRMKILTLSGQTYPPEQLPASQALLTGKEAKDELIIERPDGSRVIVDASAKPIIDKGGQVIAAVGIFDDITARKKSEEAINEQKNLLEKVFASMYEGIVILDKTGKIVDFNEAFAHICRFKNKQETLRSIESFAGLIKSYRLDGSHLPVEDWPAVKALKGEHGTNQEFIIERTDSKERWISTNSYSPLLNAQGEVIGAIQTMRDITNRKNNEKKIEDYSKKLEELVEERTKQLKDAERLAAIGATAGMVGHDIRNPLQAITSDVYLAKTELTNTVDSEEKKNALESLEEIEKNADYINKIVQDLQDYARPLNPKVEESDLKKIIETLTSKTGIPKSIKAKIDVDASAQKIKADAYYLNRILYNLVINSVQAMPNGGKLTIEANKEGDDTVISVKDTGVGIPQSIQNKMFTLMFTTKAKGQGFGLPVVKRMTESLGGCVSFTSEEGKGTTFTIRLPPPKELNGKWAFK